MLQINIVNDSKNHHPVAWLCFKSLQNSVVQDTFSHNTKAAVTVTINVIQGQFLHKVLYFSEGKSPINTFKIES